MIEYIEKGNIFKIDGVTSYAHGCNCAGAMGKGIALQFKRQYPEMYLEYKNRCSRGLFELGDVYQYKYSEGYIFNLGTQKSWRTKADISAIESAVTKMLEFASMHQIPRIAMPTIGAGLGGLNWPDVKTSLEKVAAIFPKVTLVVVERFDNQSL